MRKFLKEFCWLFAAWLGVMLIVLMFELNLPWYYGIPVAVFGWQLIIGGVARVFPRGAWPFRIKK